MLCDKIERKFRSRESCLFDADQARRRVGSIDLVMRSTNNATWHFIMTSDTRRQRRRKKSFLAHARPRGWKKKTLDEESNADECDEERRRRALYEHACETTISGRFKGSLDHENLKYDPDKARVSKNSKEKGRRYLLLILLRHEDLRSDYHKEEETDIY